MNITYLQCNFILQWHQLGWQAWQIFSINRIYLLLLLFFQYIHIFKFLSDGLIPILLYKISCSAQFRLTFSCRFTYTIMCARIIEIDEMVNNKSISQIVMISCVEVWSVDIYQYLYIWYKWLKLNEYNINGSEMKFKCMLILINIEATHL